MDYSLSELSEVFSCNPERGEYWVPKERYNFSNDFLFKMWNLRFSGKRSVGADGSGYMVFKEQTTELNPHRMQPAEAPPHQGTVTTFTHCGCLRLPVFG